jgi:hypothetical protein
MDSAEMIHELADTDDDVSASDGMPKVKAIPMRWNYSRASTLTRVDS